MPGLVLGGTLVHFIACNRRLGHIGILLYVQVMQWSAGKLGGYNSLLLLIKSLHVLI